MSKRSRWDILGRLGLGKKSSWSQAKKSNRPFGRSLQMEQLETRELLSVTGNISGSVFNDADADGFFDVNEPGWDGWTVELQEVGGTNSALDAFEDPILSLDNRFAGAVAAYGSDILIASPNSQPGVILRYDSNDELTIYSDPLEGGTFGTSMAVVGDYLIVGDPNETVSGESRAGAVYVFDLTSTDLTAVHTFQKDTPTEGDFFGYSVAALGDDEFVIGSPGDDISDVTGSGAVYHVDLSDQPPSAELISGGAVQEGAELGRSLAADWDETYGDFVVGGAPGYTTGTGAPGAAFVFDLSGATVVTTQLHRRRQHERFWPFRGDFGWTYVFVGAPLELDDLGTPDPSDDVPRGSVHVYGRGTLTESDEILRSGTEAGDFGRALAVDASGGLFVSDPFHDTVYHYSTPASTDTPTSFVSPQTETSNFGYALAASSSGLIIGDPGAIQNDRAPGAAYSFNASGTLTDTHANPNVKCLPEANFTGVPNASYVVLSTSALLGVNPGWDNGTDEDCGSVELRALPSFTLLYTLNVCPGDSNPVAGDMLGYCVVPIDETHLLVSAPGRTVGDVESAGIVYLFEIVDDEFVLHQTFNNPDPGAGRPVRCPDPRTGKPRLNQFDAGSRRHQQQRGRRRLRDGPRRDSPFRSHIPRFLHDLLEPVRDIACRPRRRTPGRRSGIRLWGRPRLRKRVRHRSGDGMAYIDSHARPRSRRGASGDGSQGRRPLRDVRRIVYGLVLEAGISSSARRAVR